MRGDPRGEGGGLTARVLIVLLLLELLSACGFRLRGTANLPHETLYVSGPAYSAFANDLKRAIRTGTNTRLADEAAKADATLFVLGENRAKVILTLTSQGTVREYQLRYAVSYRVAEKSGKEVVPPTEIAVVRSYVFNDPLAAEAEETALYRDMQQDAVQQLLRRLSVLAERPPAAVPQT